MKVCIALLPGDGIGPEIVTAGRRVLDAVGHRFGHRFECREWPVGGAAMDLGGPPLPTETLDACREADAVLLGAVGAPRWSGPEHPVRPEQGLLALRQALGLYANLRPVRPIRALIEASPIRPERLQGVDLLFVRELSSGIYYGQRSSTAEEAVDECRYTGEEIRRCVRTAGRLAAARSGRLTLIDKANVLDTSRLWRRITTALVAEEFPRLTFDVELVDAMAMHLLENPSRFDVVVTENLFGDILTDEAAMLAGSLGVLPSASLGDDGPGLFEPAHGSAPDLAGRDRANPAATLLSVALLLEHGLGLVEEAAHLEQAIETCIDTGRCTPDIGGRLGTQAAADAVIEQLSRGRAVA